MAKKPRAPKNEPLPPWYRGADVPMRVIRSFAREVAERLHPDMIILFGPYAYGTPHADSDVDILVVMPARNQLDMAFKIHWTIQPPFPLHIIVRTPKNLEACLEDRHKPPCVRGSASGGVPHAARHQTAPKAEEITSDRLAFVVQACSFVSNLSLSSHD